MLAAGLASAVGSVGARSAGCGEPGDDPWRRDDSATQQPVMGAQVIAVGTTRGALPTARRVHAAGACWRVTLRAQRLGYALAQRSVTADDGSTTTADFAFAP